MDLTKDFSNHKSLFIVIQPLSGLCSSSFLYPIHFIYGYSHLNPSDLGDCFMIGHFADNHIKLFTSFKNLNQPDLLHNK